MAMEFILLYMKAMDIGALLAVVKAAAGQSFIKTMQIVSKAIPTVLIINYLIVFAHL
jgi:hypothetical protein